MSECLCLLGGQEYCRHCAAGKWNPTSHTETVACSVRTTVAPLAFAHVVPAGSKPTPGNASIPLSFSHQTTMQGFDRAKGQPSLIDFSPTMGIVPPPATRLLPYRRISRVPHP